MPEITLEIPLTITLPRKNGKDKVFSLNMNVYRNTHYLTLNKMKKIYRDLVWDSFIIANRNGLTLEPPLRLTYTVFPKTKRRTDVANVASIIDKFSCDALVELRLMDDDDYLHIPIVIYQIGKVDKENPRCELTIESLCG